MDMIHLRKCGLKSVVLHTFSRLKWAMSTAAIVGGGAARAYAAEAEAAAGGADKSWAIPWLIVVLAVALGVFVTLRPSGRESEIKKDLRAEL